MYTKAISAGGHDMLPNPSSSVDESDVVTAVNSALVEGGTNDEVPSLYGIGVWSNTDCIQLMAEVDTGDTELGTWDDDWESDPDYSGWLWDESLFRIIEDENGNRRYDIHIDPVFDIGDKTAIGCYAWRIDDEVYVAVSSPSGNPQAQGWYESDGQTPPTYTLTTDTTVQAGKTYYKGGGALAMKFTSPIPTTDSGHAYVGVCMIKLRTKYKMGTRLT